MTALEAVTAPLADLTAALVRLKAALSDHSAESALDEGKHAQLVLLAAMAAVLIVGALRIVRLQGPPFNKAWWPSALRRRRVRVPTSPAAEL